MTFLRSLLAVPFRLAAIVSAAAGVALVAFSLGMTLLAETVSE